jgi:hypothetical protein
MFLQSVENQLKFYFFLNAQRVNIYTQLLIPKISVSCNTFFRNVLHLTEK